MITGGNFIFTSVRLGIQSSSTKKKRWNNEYQMGEIQRKSQVLKKTMYLTPCLATKKIDETFHFSCFSTETDQGTMTEVQGASVVKKTSLNAARSNLSTI